MSDEIPKGITVNKVLATIVLFVSIGLLLNSLFTSNQVSTAQDTLDSRTELFAELIKINKEQGEQIKITTEKLTNIEIKLENLEKTGKIIK